MTITEIKRKGKSELYYVYADNQFFSLIEAEFIVKNKLKVGTEISQKNLEQIKEQSDNLACVNVALNYISKALKSEYQLVQYLKKHQFCDSAITLAVEKLKSYGYLNDEYLADLVVKSASLKKGKNQIIVSLKNKGIKKENYEKFISNIQGQSDVCLSLAKKWLKGKNLPLSTQEKAKLYRHLAGKGFEFETIKSALGLIKEFNGDEDDWNWFGWGSKN